MSASRYLGKKTSRCADLQIRKCADGLNVKMRLYANEFKKVLSFARLHILAFTYQIH